MIIFSAMKPEINSKNSLAPVTSFEYMKSKVCANNIKYLEYGLLW
jgi:hypothetical protein